MAAPVHLTRPGWALVLLGLTTAVGCGRCDEPAKPTRRDPGSVAEQLLADGQAAVSAVPSATAPGGCGALFEAITAMRAKVGAGPLATDREVFVTVCGGLDPEVRRCLDPAVAAQEPAPCSARVDALPPVERDRVRGLMRGADAPATRP